LIKYGLKNKKKIEERFAHAGIFFESQKSLNWYFKNGMLAALKKKEPAVFLSAYTEVGNLKLHFSKFCPYLNKWYSNVLEIYKMVCSQVLSTGV
jgi:hypothetical protein